MSITRNYLDIQDINFSPANGLIAAFSVDSGNNTGIIFYAGAIPSPVAVGGSIGKKRPVVIIRDEEEIEEERKQEVIAKVKRLVARKIGNSPIKQQVLTSTIDIVNTFHIDLSQAQELVDNIAEQERIAYQRRMQQKDDELAIKFLFGL